MRNLTVAIGRNIGKGPMPFKRWNEFRTSLRMVFSEYPLDCSEHGRARYRETEDTLRLWFTVPDSLTDEDIVARLAPLCEKYEQWGIHYMIGESRYAHK